MTNKSYFRTHYHRFKEEIELKSSRTFYQLKLFTRASDPRLKLSLSKLDPRIHFALVCGQRNYASIIKVFTPDKIEKELEWVAEEFCEWNVQIDLQGKRIMLSKIFDWYASDFLYVMDPSLRNKPHAILYYVHSLLKGQKKSDLNFLLTTQSPQQEKQAKQVVSLKEQLERFGFQIKK